MMFLNHLIHCSNDDYNPNFQHLHSDILKFEIINIPNNITSPTLINNMEFTISGSRN